MTEKNGPHIVMVTMAGIGAMLLVYGLRHNVEGAICIGVFWLVFGALMSR